MNKPTIPHYGRLAWTPSTAEPKGLNAQKIVSVAIELADAQGLAQVTIRNLGKQLGSATMAVYRHIESRDELLILMFDTSLGEPPSISQHATSRTDAMRTWGKTIFERYQTHPWILDIPVGGVPTTPNHIAWIERILEGLVPYEALDLQHKLDIALLIDGHARTIASMSRSDRSSIMGNLHVSPEWLPQVLDNTLYPLFTEVVNRGPLADGKTLNFDDGLNIIINGIERSILSN
ncbi:MAG: TetR/AcrR family transcriptional regulator [Candidatus Saccharibacteria bacterium]